MTRPAGLVKLISQACGARSAIGARDVQRHRQRAQTVGQTAGADRLLAEQPSDSARRSSATRPAAPPTRIAENTKSAPANAAVSDVVVDTRTAGRVGQHRARSPAAVDADVVQHQLVDEPGRSDRTSARWISGTRNPPPPTITSRMLRP